MGYMQIGGGVEALKGVLLGNSYLTKKFKVMTGNAS